MSKVWIVDDDPSIRWVFEKTLKRENIEHELFSSAEEALSNLKKEIPTAIVSDVRMDGASGLELLKKIKEAYPDIPTIIMTAYSDLDSAVAAFQEGAYEYLPKPFDIDSAVELIRRAINENTKVGVTSAIGVSTSDMLGQAGSMQEVFKTIGKLANSDATVLINGESGTGKELIARALHKHSRRASKPFIAINTASIPRDLLESELFGHEKGAFTGAQVLRKGRFEQSEGGTLFLDEIGDMPAELQTRLLRVLSDGHYYRVGGHQPLKANVRVIAATHQDLEKRVEEKLFREDLFHRLNVIRVKVPSLRERVEDIPLLAEHFLHREALKINTEPKRFSETAIKYLQNKKWPGNVRQLENLCHWITVMAPSSVVGLEDLPAELKSETLDSNNGQEIGWTESLQQLTLAMCASGKINILEKLTKDFETTVISEALKFTKGRKIEAANLLGVGRNTITRKISELELPSGK
ncbi:MAG: nitrogen regulation protein NR(I) [Betaproteobacteria bacterium]